MTSYDDIIVFDTETTGLVQSEATPLEKQPKIWEFAGIRLDKNYNEVRRLEFVCDPGCDLEPIITKVTGAVTSDVKGKGEFSLYLSQLQDFFLGVREIVAHNLMFDIDMLRFELMRLDCLEQFPWPPVRTCTIESTYYINNYRLNLTKLHQYCFNESFKDAHRAMPDVEALTRCYIYLKKNEII